MSTIEHWFRERLPNVPIHSAVTVIKLTEEGATVPFIARYRKEATGNLDEVAIQNVIKTKELWDETTKRQQYILKEIGEQGKLTDELKKKIESTFDLNVLEDIYLPFKKKRKTKAQKARDAGLEPLASWVWDLAHGTAKAEPGETLETKAAAFVDASKEVADVAAAIQGAQDIIIEKLSEDQELRQFVRQGLFDEGAVASEKGDGAKPNSKFEGYFSHRESVQSLMKPENSHRYLALRRGWMEGELRLNLGANEELTERQLGKFRAAAGADAPSPGAELLKKASQLALKAYVLPSIESEVHKALKDVADEAAIKVFAENVRKVLTASPFGSKAVLGVDPGLRTGCKVAVVDESGKHVANFVFKFLSDRDAEHSKLLLTEVVKNANIRAVAVGNGTAGRETEAFVRQALTEKGLNVPVVLVNESGASIYSASDVAREEFPDLDLTVRGAISIARRLQDPLAELVKIDPKSIGVGQYQHDVSQPALKRSLDEVVDSCVNSVGVDLNTASYHLLAHVSGIGPALAKNIVEHRSTKGLFKARSELLGVSRFSQKVFEQAAGFLRVRGGENPLDNTGVHPERYDVLQKFAAKSGKSVADLLGLGVKFVRESSELKDEIGPFTFNDIVEELEKPGRDPREEFVPFSFRADIHKVEDLKTGMECPGVVTNVTNFGAFVDIGVHQDGLVHVSELSDKFVKDPNAVVSPGDRVTVKVLDVDVARSRIALTMRKGTDAKAGAHGTQDRGERRDRGNGPAASKGGFGGQRPAAGGQQRPGQNGGRPSFGGGSGKGPRPSGPGPSGSGSPRITRPGDRPKGGGGKPSRTFEEKMPLNNPFAALAGMKGKLKS